MGRVKICRVCKETLYCKSCGERQTPESPDWSSLLIRLTPEQKEKVKTEADEQGISVNELIRRKLEAEEVTDEENSGLD